MQLIAMALTAALFVVPTLVTGQFSGLFGSRKEQSKDTVVVGCGSNAPLVFSPADNDASLNIIMNGGDGSPQSPTKTIATCENGDCNQVKP